MYTLELSPLSCRGGLLSMKAEAYSSSNAAGRVSVVFSCVLFCASLHKGYVLQKLVLSCTKLYITKFSCALFSQ